MTTKKKPAKRKRATKRKRARRRKAPRKGVVPPQFRRKRGRSSRGTTRLKLDVTVSPALRLDGPELHQLSAQQRLELASMGTRKRASLRPGWASDERLWRRMARLLSRSWRRYEHPYAAVALLYLRSGGVVGHGHGVHAHRAGAGRMRGRRGGGHGSSGGHDLEVERVHLDELGYGDDGAYYGPGEPLWRVSSGPESPIHVDTVVRARTASGARAIVAQQYGH